MIIPDVNVIVGALQPDSQHHERYRRWLDSARSGPEPLALSELVLSGAVRVMTHRGIFNNPTPVGTALQAIDQLRAAATVVRPGTGHWRLFADLCREVDATGNLVPDAYHAALAIEHDAVFATNDRDFRRFPGLRISDPLE